MTGEFLPYNVKVQKVKFVIFEKFFMEFDLLTQKNNFKMIFIILILLHTMSVRNMRENTKDNQYALKNLINSTLNSINIIVKHNKSFAAVYASFYRISYPEFTGLEYLIVLRTIENTIPRTDI